MSARWLADALAAHPRRIIAVVVLLSLLALLTLVDWRGHRLRLEIDPSIERLLPAQDAERAVFDAVRRQFGDRDPVLLAVGFDTVYAPDAIARIATLTSRLRQMPGVSKVQSIANAEDAIPDEFGVSLRSFAARARDDPASVTGFAGRIAANPVYRNTLVSADGRIAALSVTLDDVDESRFRGQHYAERMVALAREVTGSDQVWITGTQVIKARTTDAILHTQRLVIPAIFVLVVVLVFAAYRSVAAVVASLASIAAALLWTLASAVLLGLTVNLVTAIVPPLVTTLCLSYSVHLLAEYYDARGDEDAGARMQRVIWRMAVGLGLSGLTTIGGFLALVPGSLPAVAHFAVLSSLGIAYSVLLTLLFVPAVLSHARFPGRRMPGSALLIRKARRLAMFALRRRNAIIAIGVLTVVPSVYFASRIEIGTEYIKSFDAKSTVRRDFEKINHAFDGATVVSIVIDTHVDDALADPGRAREIDALDDWLRQQPEVGTVVSYVDYLKLINRNFSDGNPAHARIPDNKAAIKQLLILGGGDEIHRVIDARLRQALITVRIKVDGSAAIGRFVRRAEARLKQMPEPLVGQLTGNAVLATRTVDRIADGQTTSLAVALVVIWLMLGVMFTSMRSALIAMLPNVLPVALYFGALGALGISLSPTTSLIACVVLGIAVDDTIHFMARFNADARDRASEKAAVKRTLAALLRPLTLTMFALCVGFLVFTASELRNQVQFGALAAFTLFVAWVADITLTPALGSKLRIVTLWDILRLDLGQSPQHSIPLLSGLSLRQSRVFALMSKLERHRAGERLIHQGEFARDIYVVVDGRLRVWVDANGDQRNLATLGRGSVMGETGYFGQRRTANVDAETPVRVLRFDSGDLENLRRRYPRIAAVIYRNLNRIQAERLARATAML